jgi:protein-S-isoprenylcysteine O-methyltransferase Ste14
MELFPHLRLGLLNGWIFSLLLNLAIEVITRTSSPDVEAKFYDYSAWARRDWMLERIGGLFTFALFFLWILTPLKVGSWLLGLGTVLFAAGGALLIQAMLTFRNTPLDQPVTGGLYKTSRNPQSVAFAIASLGTCIAVGSWAAVLVLIVQQVFFHFRILAKEKTCLARFGDAYRKYMQRVPRYLVFF